MMWLRRVCGGDIRRYSWRPMLVGGDRYLVDMVDCDAPGWVLGDKTVFWPAGGTGDGSDDKTGC